MSFLKRFALPIFGMLVGAFFFFPWNEVRDQISSVVQKQSGIQIQMQRFAPTLGLRMGLGKGSLLAFSAGKASVRLPNGIAVSCNELVVGPRFWPLLMTQFQIAAACYTEEGGSLIALTTAAPFWSPSTLNESVALDSFSLENVDLKSNVSGVLSGSVDATNISLLEGGIPDVQWNLTGKKVRTPEANIPLLKLPSLDLGDLKTTGTLNARSMKIDALDFGSSEGVLEGNITFQSTLSPENFFPTDGEIAGNLRVDPSAEQGSLRDVPWRTFGTADGQGKRTFKRSFTGGIQNLFLSFPGS